MWQSVPSLVRFALDAERIGDVVFKVCVLVILSPVLLVLCVADAVGMVVRRW
jgi:lipopolysaccharide/colanic/teichoic acid biosynthesis glycosyltransferase